MRKKHLRLCWPILMVCCAAFFLYFGLTRNMGDQVPPEITVPEGVLQLSVKSDDRAFLEGLTAEDDRDGDVTDLLVVESLSAIYDGNRSDVTVAAFDRSGNCTKALRTVEFPDYSHPRFVLYSPLLYREGAKVDVFSAIGATDVVDGSLDHWVKGSLSKGDTYFYIPGDYEVEFRVTNSLGDTVHLALPVEIQSSNASLRRLELTDYLIYLKTGDSFDPADYVAPASLDWVGWIENPVDTEKPGLYRVVYQPERADIYAKTQLMVVVED